MSYELRINIQDGSVADSNIEALAQEEHLSREEAALKILESLPTPRRTKASPEALAILGAFSSPEDAAIMDEALEIAMEDRRRRNAAPPHA